MLALRHDCYADCLPAYYKEVKVCSGEELIHASANSIISTGSGSGNRFDFPLGGDMHGFSYRLPHCRGNSIHCTLLTVSDRFCRFLHAQGGVAYDQSGKFHPNKKSRRQRGLRLFVFCNSLFQIFTDFFHKPCRGQNLYGRTE